MPKSADKRSRQRGAPAANGHSGKGATDRAVDSVGDPSRTQDREPALDALPPFPPALFIDRDLSWLAFNERVRCEAEDVANPLLERVWFAAICAANLDEFFMIRVAGIKRKIAAGIDAPGPDGRTPAQLLTAIRARAQRALDRRARLVTGELLPALAEHQIAVVPFATLTDVQQAALARHFAEDIFPILTPQALDPGRRFPHVSNLSLNLIALLALPEGPRYARIKIPATLPRFVAVPDGAATGDGQAPRVFTWLEEVIAANLPRLFPGAAVDASYLFHVVRDSDIDLTEEDDADRADPMVMMRESIARRAFGPVVRLTVDSRMPDTVRRWLLGQLRATDQDCYVVDGPLAAANLAELAALDRPDLKFRPLIPAPVAQLTPHDEHAEGDVFARIRARDVLIHHPYQSFDAVVEFLRAAATDQDVVAIKQTLYRLGKDSPLIPALIAARDDDTQVAVVVELKARFDEENNITWAEALERHGVDVAYGLARLKTHCKALLVVRREPDGLRRYVHLATGNYNATTARLYEDFGYLTAREDIGADVSDLFNALTGFARHDTYRRLWVAPGAMRTRLLASIKREIAVHRRTGAGRLAFKVNALVDRTLIRALYQASRAGVQIDLIVRGPCCLVPGVPGWSDTIRVISIVGRFLEHSRIYYFGNGGEDEVYLGSADLMERNLDRRVEVSFPVADPGWAAQIRDEILPAYFRDTVNAWALGPDGTYRRLMPGPGVAPFDVQAWLIDRYCAADGEHAVG